MAGMLLGAVAAMGQVQFSVELLPDGVTYQVSMLPQVTWNPPLNITSTAQVTLKVPTGGFSPAGVASQQPGTFWAQNARFDQPAEASGYDYLTFGLTSLGTTGFSYQQGVEVPLFTFHNAGICTGAVEIMQNSDPFFPPNSLSANVNCQIATLGTGFGSNGFAGAYALGGANCLVASNCEFSFELDQLADGTYQVSVVPKSTWSAPDNLTDTLAVTVKAPTGSLSVANLQSLVSNAAFSVVNTFTAPASNAGFDYHLIRLTTGPTAGINYTENVKTPVFTFENAGTCNGNSLELADYLSDPFLQNTPAARMRLRINGLSAGVYVCESGNSQPMQPVLGGVSAISATDCPANGVINVSATGVQQLDYTVDGGNSWQPDYLFSSLGAGSYQVAVRYANQTCPVFFLQNPVVLTAPAQPAMPNVTGLNPTDCSSADGSIIIQVPGGQGLEYSINNGATWSNSHIFNGLGAGSYQVKVRNGNGSCPVDGGTTVLTSPGIAPTISSLTVSDPTSCGAADGSIAVQASGAGPFEYSLNNGLTWTTNAVFHNLNIGDYNLMVRSQVSGCAAVYPLNPVQLETPGCPGCLVEYELEVLPNGRYQVSMIPDTTWVFPMSVTGTAQVTILAPTGSFFVADLTNLLPGVEFKDNVRVDHPVENPAFDYISFGLQTLGTTGIPYQKGVKVPLFTFQNGGVCAGPYIYLMDDNTDPFVPPNSVSSNPGQQLTTLGAGSDALVCIRQPGVVQCLPEMANQLTAVNDAFSGFVNVQVTGGSVTANDLNPANNILAVNLTPVQPPAHGTVVLQANGSFTYQPEPGFTGFDQFQYLVCDDGMPAVCDVATVTINIQPPFAANNDGYTTATGQPVQGQVLANDSDPANAAPTVTLLPGTGPQNGSLTLQPTGNFVYLPNPGFVGIDVFQYQSCEVSPYQWCDTALVTIQVLPAVQALDDQFATLPNQAITQDVTDNDLLQNGAPVVVTLLPGSQPQHGMLNLSTNGSFTYVPNPGFVGTDEFEYVICQQSSITTCDTATVTITVTPGLVAIDDQYSTPAGVSLVMDFTENDLVPQGSLAGIFVLPGSYPANGEINLNPDGTFTYEPDQGFAGQDSFEYVICTSGLPAYCDTASVLINVVPSLVANDDQIGLPIGGTATGNVLGNDLNPLGNPLTVSLLPNSGPDQGDLVLNPDGGFIYTPDPGFTGQDSFEYVACDLVANTCDTALVTILVSPELVANDDFYNLLQGASCTGDVLSNDEVPVGQSVVASLIPGSGPQHGSAVLQPNGQFSYQPNSGFTGTDFFDYQICLVQIVPVGVTSVCDTARVYLTTYDFSPPVPTTSCPPDVCAGEDIHLAVLQNYVGNNVQYQWVNASNQTIGFGQSLALNSASSMAQPPFRVRVTVDGHQTGYSAACDIDIAPAPVAQPIGPGSVCPGTDVQLSATGLASANYEWRVAGQPGIVSAIQNPLFFNILQTTTYELTVISDGCGQSATSSTTVVVQPGASIAGISGGGTYCHGSEVVLSALNGTATSGNVQYTWTGPDGFFFTNSAPANGPFPLTLSTLVAENEGAYTLSLETLDGCVSQPQSVIVDYLPQPAPPALSASDPVLCQGETLVLNASLATGNNVGYTWYQLGANGPAQVAVTPYPTLFLNNVTSSNTGSYFVTATVDGCTSEPSNLQQVEVVGSNTVISATNTTDASAPACEGTEVQFSAPLIPGALYFWYGPAGFYDNAATPLIDAVAENMAGDYLLVVQLPGCGTAVAATTTVFVNPVPETPILLSDGPACEGSNVELSVANGANGLTYELYFAPTGQLVGSSSSPTFLLDDISMAEAGGYFVMATENGCVSSPSLPVPVEVIAMPTNLADAGDDQTICGLITAINLGATPPSVGTGNWVSTSGADVINPDQSNTLAEGLVLGQNMFVWSLSQGACQSYSADTVVINVVDVPNEVAFAGVDVQVCGSTVLNLAASPLATASGSWSQPTWQAAAGVEILDPTSPTSPVIGLVPGYDFTFIWSASFGGCADFSTDEMIVAANQAPDDQAFVSDATLFVCDESSVELIAEAPTGSNGKWTSPTGASVASPGSFHTMAGNLAEGENVFVWSLTADGCPNFSSDTLTVFNEVIGIENDTFVVPASDSLVGASVVENDLLGEEWELVIVAQPTKGVATHNGDGSFTYVPYPNGFGEDELTYRICSKNCPDICDMGRVTFRFDQSSVDPDDCYVPNTITPDGDGLNDTFIVPCSASYPGSSCKIFNRWGDLVFASEDYKNDWNGTYDGEPVPTGTYFYVLFLNSPDPKTVTGYVVVSR